MNTIIYFISNLFRLEHFPHFIFIPSFYPTFDSKCPENQEIKQFWPKVHLWYMLRRNVECKQQRHRPACASAQSDQHLCFSFSWKYNYSKNCVKPPLSKRPKIAFLNQLSLTVLQVESIADCSKGSNLQYFWPSLSYHLSLRPLFCLFLSGCFTQIILYS